MQLRFNWQGQTGVDGAGVGAENRSQRARAQWNAASRDEQ